uniref:ATP-dependent (S)-NAD(P)H-hydrate dehydratase n=1 Tax=Lygus hesperus TaxID=30085 RepID=A0A0A9Z1U1_LYGHE
MTLAIRFLNPSHFSISALRFLCHSSPPTAGMSSLSTEAVLARCAKLVPVLSETDHKGTSGRIGIFGGSVEFTGAPYYAGYSALRAGADLVYVFAASSASPIIKSYCPELMVIPYLDADEAVIRISPWTARLHAVLIGPGMGRHEMVFSNVLKVLDHLKSGPGEQGYYRPLIFDADGLHFLSHHPLALKDYPGDIYLTPNIVEFNKLVSVVIGHRYQQPTERDLQELSRAIGKNVTIVLKGNIDLIADSSSYFSCDVEGSFRRCGGQGDMLSGILSVFAGWAAIRRFTNYPPLMDTMSDNVLACFSACYITRTCNRSAFKKYSRSMLVTDMLKELPSIFVPFCHGKVHP